MRKSLKPRSKGFTAYYAVSLALVALSSGAAVFASLAPASATAFMRGLDTQVALFLVPLAALMFAIIAEVLYATFRGTRPAAIAPRATARHWKPGHGEG